MAKLNMATEEAPNLSIFEQIFSSPLEQKTSAMPLTEEGPAEDNLTTRYSEFAYPPDLAIARLHGVASCHAAGVPFQ